MLDRRGRNHAVDDGSYSVESSSWELTVVEDGRLVGVDSEAQQSPIVRQQRTVAANLSIARPSG